MFWPTGPGQFDPQVDPQSRRCHDRWVDRPSPADCAAAIASPGTPDELEKAGRMVAKLPRRHRVAYWQLVGRYQLRQAELEAPEPAGTAYGRS